MYDVISIITVMLILLILFVTVCASSQQNFSKSTLNLSDTCDYSIQDKCGGVCADGFVDCECGNSTFNIWRDEKYCCLQSSDQCSTKLNNRGVILDEKGSNGYTLCLLKGTPISRNSLTTRAIYLDHIKPSAFFAD